MTAIEPPEGLLDKIAEAQWSLAIEPCDREWNPDLARAAWDAVVEGLGLTEELRYVEPITPHPEPTPIERRLVSRWEAPDAP